MLETEITIINKLGLHARAAAKLVKLVSSFDSHVEIGRPDNMVNAKSIMGVMMLAAGCGSELKITADGADEQEAMTAVVDLINDRFEEEE
ncbi:HPr family phosphocarrier protein [Granulosicoccaceae sp. 1_MG-2023]|nr:HPr family phosphocarrier protein [Granulosicoccaceae sp. 1_MG-2023]